MDTQTLNQLKLTFSATPSLALAELVFSQLQKQPEATADWAQLCADKLSAENRLLLAEHLSKNKDFDVALRLLNDAEMTHWPLWVKLNCKLGNHNMVELRMKALAEQGHEVTNLQSYLTESMSAADITTDESVESEGGELNQSAEEKVKLKVVEKLDFADITDLHKYQQQTTDFNDVVGLDVIKKQINKKIILPFQKPSLFQRFKKKVGGGVLLYGPPGCGKTLLARATAGECNAAFFNVEISDILDMYIGESEQKLHAIFEKARSETPSVLFFDEFEALAGKRESHRNSTSSNLVSQFLTELDGFTQNNSGVLVLASTNVPWSIDSAFLRPGRFDRMFFVPPPDKTAREGILKHHMQERPADQNINFAAIAAKAKAYSGADLHNLVEMAADEAIDDSIEQNKDTLISQTHFKLALQESHSSTIEWLTTARNYARYANDGGRYNEVLKFLQKHGK